jgi:hypothetical protein
MPDLADFLLARIDEDELAAQRVEQRDNFEQPITTLTGAEIFDARGVMFPTARVLAECEAKRRIVEEHGPWTPEDEYCAAHDGRMTQNECPTLRALALPYADHEGFREEWRV